MPPESSQRSAKTGSSASTHECKTEYPSKIKSCDVCRRRKARCDGDSASGTQCATCRTLRVDCTYTKPEKAKVRLPTVSVRVKQLEERQKQLERLLEQFVPEVDLSGDLDDLDCDILAERVSGHLAEMGPFRFCRQSGEERNFQSEHESITLAGEQAAAVPTFLKGRHYGKSSSAVLVKSIFEWKAYEQSVGKASKPGLGEKAPNLPPAGWNVAPWEESLLCPFFHPSNCAFPDDDLLCSLVDLYFDHVNLFTPLLHRPTFDRLLLDKIHVKDSSLGSVVLLVCAIGARFSDDPRVFFTESTLSAGWQWFDLAHKLGERPLAPASLFDIQASVLRAEFLRGPYTSYSAWTVLGVGLRRAQDVGAHRWDTFGTEKSPERELWGRAWWCLVVLDRIASAYLGQPCITEGYDFDIDLPTECDDEYWEHSDPAKSWQQPEGVPSKLSFFVAYIKQTQIIVGTHAFLYSLDKTKRAWMIDVFHDFERRVVLELDSALNKWIDNIPAHLRNPHNSQLNSMFHRQSVVLHAELYFLQILMHRPFLTNPDKSSGMTAASLAICTNAARACSRLLDTEDISCRNVVYRIQWPIFSSAVVLLLTVWTGKRMGVDGSYAKEVQNIEKCKAMLAQSERCWQSSGKLVDIISSLVAASDLTAPRAGSQPTSASSNPSDSSQSTLNPEPDISSLFSGDNLPLYTEELASIPLFSGLPAQDAWGICPDTVSSPHTGDFAPSNELFLFPPRDPVCQPHALRQDQPAESRQAHPPDDSFPDPGPVPPAPANIFDFDADTMAVWTSAPHGFNFGDWGAYVDNVNEIQLSSDMGNMRMP